MEKIRYFDKFQLRELLFLKLLAIDHQKTPLATTNLNIKFSVQIKRSLIPKFSKTLVLVKYRVKKYRSRLNIINRITLTQNPGLFFKDYPDPSFY